MMEKIILLPCQVVSKMNILIIFKMLLILCTLLYC